LIQKPINATLGAYSAVIFMCVTLALNVACLIAYRLTKSQESMTEDSGIESRLTFYALLTFLGQLLMAIYYVRNLLSVKGKFIENIIRKKSNFLNLRFFGKLIKFFLI
jgi:hypothetical protein